MRRKLQGGLLAALFLSACASAPDIPGIWRGTSSNAAGTVLQFHADGRLTWTFPAGTVEARYATRGHELDITDFSGGLLQGSALYCLFEFQTANRMRMDCERGKPGQTGVRPKAYDPQQTQIFQR